MVFYEGLERWKVAHTKFYRPDIAVSDVSLIPAQRVSEAQFKVSNYQCNICWGYYKGKLLVVFKCFHYMC